MRFFVALQLSPKVTTSLSDLIRRLEPCSGLHWVSPRNMHLTLKYIGEWPSEKTEEIIKCLNEIRMPLREMILNIPLAGLGFFPNSHQPKVFWAGAENTPGLRQLASVIDSALQSVGVAPAVRPYQPHLTLARINDDALMDGLLRAIEDLPSREFGVISPDRFGLFESNLTENGSSYRKIAEFPFLKQSVDKSPYLAGRRPMRVVAR